MKYPDADREKGRQLSTVYGWLGDDRAKTWRWLQEQLTLSQAELDPILNPGLHPSEERFTADLPWETPDFTFVEQSAPGSQWPTIWVRPVANVGGAATLPVYQALAAAIPAGRLRKLAGWLPSNGGLVALWAEVAAGDEETVTALVVWDVNTQRVVDGPIDSAVPLTLDWIPDGSGYCYATEFLDGPAVHVRRQQGGDWHDSVVWATGDELAEIDGLALSEDGRYIALALDNEEKMTVLVGAVQPVGMPLTTLTGHLTTDTEIWFDGSRLLVQTGDPAQVTSVDPARPTSIPRTVLVKGWPSNLPANPDNKPHIRETVTVGNEIVVLWETDGAARLTVHDSGGKQPREIVLPGLVAIADIKPGRPGSGMAWLLVDAPGADRAMYTYTTGAAAVVRQDLWPPMNPTLPARVTREYFARDTVEGGSPLYLVHLESAPPDGKRPVLIVGAGAEEIEALFTHPDITTWVSAGGVVALPISTSWAWTIRWTSSRSQRCSVTGAWQPPNPSRSSD